MMIWVIVAVSYRLLATTGEFSLGHVVVMAIGAYSSAIMSRNMGMSFWITAPLGGLIAAGFAAATARPLFRMKGFYFLLGSFALGEAIRLCFRGFKVKRPIIKAVLSPSLLAIQPCATSCTVMANNTGKPQIAIFCNVDK